MMKLTFLLVIAILIANFVTVFAHNGSDYKTETIHIKIFPPDLYGKERSLSLDKNNGDFEMAYLSIAGRPRVPLIIEHIELPFHAKDIKVNVNVGEVRNIVMNREIEASPSPIPLSTHFDDNINTEKKSSIYLSDEPYPEDWFDFCIRSGLNDKNTVVKHLFLYFYPYRYKPGSKTLIYAADLDVTITYSIAEKDNENFGEGYDMVIVSPKCFAKELEKLVKHKNSLGIRTFLKTTEKIYEEFHGRDKAEKIKYFIKYAKEKYNITYVLLVGGLKSLLWAKPRDNCNEGSVDWYVPVRYTNLYDPNWNKSYTYDPGTISDLYFADLYDGNGNFSSWDTNNDGIFAAWNKPGVEDDKNIDFYPDVIVGRLPCRNIWEVRSVVKKIIKYEKYSLDKRWYKRVVVVAGDNYLDQENLDIKWNISNLPDGKYSIYAQAFNKDGEGGNIDKVVIWVCKDFPSIITFDCSDVLDSYPNYPVAEITSPSDLNILGKNDVTVYLDDDVAPGNELSRWADIVYENKTMHIKGKCYDPKPYSNLTSIHVWVENENHEIVFSTWKNDTEMYYEGEWITGEKLLYGRGGALYYMPKDFEKIKLWTSNGNLRGMRSVFKEFNRGAGFVYFEGHSSPNAWMCYRPGFSTEFGDSNYVIGLRVSLLKGLLNFGKLPVVVLGGCHSALINRSLIPLLIDNIFYILKGNYKYRLWGFSLIPECLAWYLVKLPYRGGIASIGNTGLEYYVTGKYCTCLGYGPWLNVEFFRQYGEKNRTILGDAFVHAIGEYIKTFYVNIDPIDAKTIQQWLLLGDPSLRLGGYDLREE